MTRFDTLFSLRYAVRVLERQSRFWRRLDGALRFLTIVSGSAAFAALLTQQSPAINAVALAAFAALQALEFSLQPGQRAAMAWVARLPYLEAMADQSAMDDDSLEAAYRAALLRDDIQAFESLRRIAYNDVVEEMGCSPEHAYTLGGWHQMMRAMA